MDVLDYRGSSTTHTGEIEKLIEVHPTVVTFIHTYTHTHTPPASKVSPENRSPTKKNVQLLPEEAVPSLFSSKNWEASDFSRILRRHNYSTTLLPYRIPVHFSHISPRRTQRAASSLNSSKSSSPLVSNNKRNERMNLQLPIR